METYKIYKWYSETIGMGGFTAAHEETSDDDDYNDCYPTTIATNY